MMVMVISKIMVVVLAAEATIIEMQATDRSPNRYRDSWAVQHPPCPQRQIMGELYSHAGRGASWMGRCAAWV